MAICRICGHPGTQHTISEHEKHNHLGTTCHWPGTTYHVLPAEDDKQMRQWLLAENLALGGGEQANGKWMCKWPNCGSPANHTYDSRSALQRHLSTVQRELAVANGTALQIVQTATTVAGNLQALNALNALPAPVPPATAPPAVAAPAPAPAPAAPVPPPIPPPVQPPVPPPVQPPVDDPMDVDGEAGDQEMASAGAGRVVKERWEALKKSMEKTVAAGPARNLNTILVQEITNAITMANILRDAVDVAWGAICPREAMPQDAASPWMRIITSLRSATTTLQNAQSSQPLPSTLLDELEQNKHDLGVNITLLFGPFSSRSS
ncbi:hypothetical protein GGR53DRAFT_530420 [Hypoxylon sp. FL1150]|nr:hypothetical protein GGR53DRAFT_530420 [Hypoxylon sp. FL1150]